MIDRMGRWEPNARGRLELAALELFGERGFDQTTAAEIAARAGVTERTFFRHYADKREVLFGSSNPLRDFLEQAVAAAPRDAAPIDAAAHALATAGATMQERAEFVRQRQTVILANPELLERELAKRTVLVAAVAGALRERGVTDPTATLVAETAIAVFHVAFQSWVRDGGDLPDAIRSSFAQLKAVATGQ